MLNKIYKSEYQREKSRFLLLLVILFFAMCVFAYSLHVQRESQLNEFSEIENVE